MTSGESPLTPSTSASPWSPPSLESGPPPERRPADDDDVLPLLDILYRPAPTMRYLLRHPSRLLPGLGLMILVRAWLNLELAGAVEMPGVLLLSFAVAPIFMAVGLAISTFVVWGIGRLFGGQGAFLEVAAALLWGAVPYIGFEALQFGANVMPATFWAGVPTWIPIAFVGVGLVFWVWSFAWQVVTVAEAHRFGWFESFVSLTAPALTLFAFTVVGVLTMLSA